MRLASQSERGLPRWLFGAVVIAGLMATRIPEAKACSPNIYPALNRSLPANGAVDVPTDVQPFVFGADYGLELLDAEGVVVPSTVEDFRTKALVTSTRELIPDEPLKPHRTYTLRTMREDVLVDEIQFTTGEGPLDAAPPIAPEVHVEFYDLRAAGSSTCGGSAYQSCIDFESDGNTGTWTTRMSFQRFPSTNRKPRRA